MTMFKGSKAKMGAANKKGGHGQVPKPKGAAGFSGKGHGVQTKKTTGGGQANPKGELRELRNRRLLW